MTPRLDPAEIPAAPHLEFEYRLSQAGCQAVAGLDEAGRGAWAGPVFAAAVILPAEQEICLALRGVRDSKQMKPSERQQQAEVIRACALAWGIGQADAAEIDADGILPATRLAMTRALAALTITPAHLLIDALFLPEVDLPQTALIKGDNRSLSIAAASVLAKTARDAWMRAAAADFPVYGFERHKGYGTAVHQAALENHGPCPLHRKSFQPVRAYLPIR